MTNLDIEPTADEREAVMKLALEVAEQAEADVAPRLDGATRAGGRPLTDDERDLLEAGFKAGALAGATSALLTQLVRDKQDRLLGMVGPPCECGRPDCIENEIARRVDAH
jgi:hypothetical protein